MVQKVAEPFTALGWLIRWDQDREEWIASHANGKVLIGPGEILAELQVTAGKRRSSR